MIIYTAETQSSSVESMDMQKSNQGNQHLMQLSHSLSHSEYK